MAGALVVVGDSVEGTCVVGSCVVGAGVLGCTVVGAAVVGCSVLGARVVVGKVVGAFVEGLKFRYFFKHPLIISSISLKGRLGKVLYYKLLLMDPKLI